MKKTTHVEASQFGPWPPTMIQLLALKKKQRSPCSPSRTWHHFWVPTWSKKQLKYNKKPPPKILRLFLAPSFGQTYFFNSKCKKPLQCSFFQDSKAAWSKRMGSWWKSTSYLKISQGVPSLKLTVRTPKIRHPKRKLVFQPSIFRCYVSFWGSNMQRKKGFKFPFPCANGQNRHHHPLRSHTFRSLRFRRVLLGIHQIIIYAHLIMCVVLKNILPLKRGSKKQSGRIHPIEADFCIRTIAWFWDSNSFKLSAEKKIGTSGEKKNVCRLTCC